MDFTGSTTPATDKPKRQRASRKKTAAPTRTARFRRPLTVFQRVRDAAVRGHGLGITAADARALCQFEGQVSNQASLDDDFAIERASGGQGDLDLQPSGRGLTAREQMEAAAQADEIEST